MPRFLNSLVNGLIGGLRMVSGWDHAGNDTMYTLSFLKYPGKRNHGDGGRVEVGFIQSMYILYSLTMYPYVPALKLHGC